MESRGPDDFPGPGVDREQRPARCQGFAKEYRELRLGVTIRLGMLLPDERVGRNGVQGREIIGAQRPEGEECAMEGGLEIKGHGQK